ncbi:putative alkaline phosphatase [Shewanella sediminis HAW-EB3]|uniref:Putative alkaline phosphatase n=1 Tax=Shewanella sediminis (strain HAW-EB3) TaxID=425104 RepID=A8FS86_SHESH|nr:alkaline phosphatase [Shewanella sediminis]ABV35709.1 putative alkaline phosphatase [Shewanella sediminis HAW-EB3]
MRALTACLTLSILSSGIFTAQATAREIVIEDEHLPRNIIYLIGDGMGPAYTSAYRYYSDNPDTKPVEKTIFDDLLVGMASTYPDDDTYVTDSAAAATALATSTKSYNGAISVDHQHHALPTLLEIAKHKGKTTAIVVTSQINHATPASFLAHNESRGNYNAIADSYLTNLIKGKPVADLMLGGGTKYFVREQRDLTSEFEALGYQYIDRLEQLDEVETLPALGLFAPSGLPAALGSDDPLRLTTMTHSALRLLSSQSAPFVMMIEGSQIDWCGHSNDIVCAMTEMHDFANTLERVKRYIDNHPDTLLVATADHSTGGLTLGKNGVYQWKGKQLQMITMLPEEIADKLIASPKILDKPDSFNTFWSEYIGIIQSVEAQDKLRQQILANLQQDKGDLQTAKDKVETLIKSAIDTLTHTGWTTSGHDGIDVQIFAYGRGSHYFAGHMDNTEIAANLIEMINSEKASHNALLLEPRI